MNHCLSLNDTQYAFQIGVVFRRTQIRRRCEPKTKFHGTRIAIVVHPASARGDDGFEVVH